LRDQFVVVGKLAGGDEGRDFFAEGIADPRDAFQFIFADERAEVVFEHFEGAGAVVVGADLERIFALELEQKGDALEDVDDLIAGDRRHGEIVAAAGRLRREKTEECPWPRLFVAAVSRGLARQVAEGNQLI
jgi:hypothetical protein